MDDKENYGGRKESEYMNKTVIGVFRTNEDATDAINDLKNSGFNPKDISIFMKDRRAGKHIAHDTGTEVAEDVTGGAVSGAVIGGLAGLVAAFFIPGLGAFFIGGPLAATLGLTGAAATTASGMATGALAGGIIGALSNMGVPEEDARVYESHINNGGIFVAVPASDDEVKDVMGVFDDYGAEQVKTVSNDREEIREYEGAPSSPYVYAGAKGGKVKRKIRPVRKQEEYD